MDRIKLVLLFDTEDERQREVGEFLKAKSRCKTAWITDLVYGWLQNRSEAGGKGGQGSGCWDYQQLKAKLLADAAFLEILEQKIHQVVDGKGCETGEATDVESDLDMDNDMFLAGLAMFESQV